MSSLRFEWDPGKAASNARKHGVSFQEAITAFADDHGKIIPSPDHPGDETRFILMGYSVKNRMLVVVHCFRTEHLTIRIISARKATPSEKLQYGR